MFSSAWNSVIVYYKRWMQSVLPFMTDECWRLTSSEFRMTKFIIIVWFKEEYTRNQWIRQPSWEPKSVIHKEFFLEMTLTVFIVHVFKRSWSLLSNEMKPQCIIKLFQQVWRKIPNCMISVLKINLCIDIKLVFFFPLHWLCCIKVDEMRYSVD